MSHLTFFTKIPLLVQNLLEATIEKAAFSAPYVFGKKSWDYQLFYHNHAVRLTTPQIQHKSLAVLISDQRAKGMRRDPGTNGPKEKTDQLTLSKRSCLTAEIQDSKCSVSLILPELRLLVEGFAVHSEIHPERRFAGINPTFASKFGPSYARHLLQHLLRQTL